jgi:C-terminal domain on Strawberry notch homologue
VQQLGRTHRSNQRQPPLYLIVASDICGEQRFASAGIAQPPHMLTYGLHQSSVCMEIEAA